jgi:peroxiredoxin
LPRRMWLRICLLVICMAVAGELLRCEGEKKSNPGNKKSEVSETPKLMESPQEGFLAPSFSLQDLSGKSVSLGDFKGKVVLLNFWASWCGPCRIEIPSLNRLYQLRKDKNFEILAVSVDRGSVSKIASFVASNEMSFPVLVNPQGDVGSRYWVRAIPTSFLLDKKGVIRWKVVGGKQWDGDEAVAKIDQLLSE